MGEKREESHAAGNGWACRCVVLVEAGSARPAVLLSGLRQRGAAVRLATDAASAMVELHEFCAQALIICQPEQSPTAEALVRAAHFCHPHLVCWSYGPPTPGSSAPGAAGKPGNGQVERLVPFAVRKNHVARPPRFESADLPLPTLAAARLPDQRPDEMPGVPGAGGQHLVAPVEPHNSMTQPAELSADELEMLLGPDFADPAADETP